MICYASLSTLVWRDRRVYNGAAITGTEAVSVCRRRDDAFQCRGEVALDLGGLSESLRGASVVGSSCVSADTIFSSDCTFAQDSLDAPSHPQHLLPCPSRHLHYSGRRAGSDR